MWKKATPFQETIAIIIMSILLIGLIIATILSGGNKTKSAILPLNLDKSNTDITGTWHSTINNFITITFNKDGSYTSENYLTKGSYSIKKGVVSLRDVYNDTTKLYLVTNNDGETVLYYEAAAFVSIFSKTDDANISGIASAPIEEPMSDLEQLVASSIIQTLCAIEWDGKDNVLGNQCQLSFTRTTLLINENGEKSELSYHIGNPSEKGTGFSSIIFVNADECELTITIEPDAGEYLYSLQIISKNKPNDFSYSAHWRGEMIEYAST